MHKEYFRYTLWMKTDDLDIWNPDIQLAFMAGIEDLELVNVARDEYKKEDVVEAFSKTGFENIKTMTHQGTFTIMSSIFGHKIVFKYTFEDISDQIKFAKQNALQQAIKTGIYHGINPLYTTRPEEESLADEIWEDKDYDTMDGHDFEMFCADILSRNGYSKVIVTKGSGDQGLDIIAEQNGVKYGIQCKCYAGAVGNQAVMEAYSGKAFYGCNVAVVLSNRTYTKAAIELAERNGVVLWDRRKLEKLIKDAKK